MQIPVLIEPIKGNRYRARGVEPFDLTAEGATREEALAQLKTQIQARLKNGAELVPLEVNSEPHPWMEFAGMFDANDPEVKEWERAMADCRRKIDEHPERP